jgi:hypothetical protein
MFYIGKSVHFVIHCTLNTVLLILGTIHDKFQDDVTLYTDIGSDVILKCKVANTTRSIWRRENTIISNGLNINPELQHRLRIIGDKTLGEYNLQISDLTERDLGSYWCERHVNDVVNEKQVVIQLTGEQLVTSSNRNCKCISRCFTNRFVFTANTF